MQYVAQEFNAAYNILLFVMLNLYFLKTGCFFTVSKISFIIQIGCLYSAHKGFAKIRMQSINMIIINPVDLIRAAAGQFPLRVGHKFSVQVFRKFFCHQNAF